MKRLFGMCVMLLGLAGCTPSDVQYCRALGVEGTAEHGNCMDYYHQQEAAFGNDRAVCEREADRTYPPTLYDYGGYAQTGFGGGWGGWGHHYNPYYGGTIFIEPDYRKNAEVDRLRMNIVEPCMQARGWNSGRDWQAGRHAVKAQPRRAPAPAAEKLPWAK